MPLASRPPTLSLRIRFGGTDMIGPGKGGAVLTERGQAVLAEYRALQAAALDHGATHIERLHGWLRRGPTAPCDEGGLAACGKMICSVKHIMGLQMPTRRHALSGLLVAALLPGSGALADDPPVIAAAFAAETGKEVELSFGSTGNLVTRIRQGAPFQMFMAAD